jgi:hypothetical protein
VNALPLLAFILWLLAGAVAAQTTEDLQRAIKQRDERIRELTEKFEALGAKPELADEELARALERTLVQEGLLVLPRGRYELHPQLSYAHWDSDRGPVRSAWGASLTARAGVGWDTQLQLTVPYAHVATSAASSTGLGDVSISATRQLAPERGPFPGLLASAGWVASTGEDASGGRVPLGTGFDVLQAGVSLLKRADPLVYYGGATYSLPLPRDIAGVRVEPGHSYGMRAGTALAVTPYTSMNAALNLIVAAASQVGGQRLSDSDAMLGTLQIGIGTVLGPALMLNFGGEFRFSGPVPNFRLTIGVPLRF